MTLDDSGLSKAFRAEADNIEVPPRPRRHRRTSPWAPIAALVIGAAAVLAGLIAGRALDEFRSSPSGVAASASPSVTVKPSPNSVVSDRYGLILDGRPPTVVSELPATPIATLRGDFFRGAVSPDGRKIAYWETYSAPTVRTLWLLDTSSPTQPRVLLTLPESETAAVSTGSAVAWSSDGSGLLLAVNSVEVASRSAPPDALPLYSTLRRFDIADGSVHEVVRTERRASWFSPIGWDRARGISAAAVVGPGGFATGYIVVQDGAAPREGRLPSQTITLQGYVRAAPDASAVLMRGFPENRELYVWPLTEPTQVRTLRAGADEYVARAMWRNPREIVVSLSRSSASDAGDRLEVWNLDGSRRVLVTAAHRLDAVRPDGTAAITDRGAVDLESGTVEDIPGMRRVLTAVVLR